LASDEEPATEAAVLTKSQGKAKKPMIRTDPVGLFLAGGRVMPLILLASIITLWFGLERMFVLRRGRVIPGAFVKRFLQHLDEGKLTAETALRLCEENQSPMASIFAHGVRKWGKTSVEIEQAIIDGGERQVAQLRNNMRVINGMANISPMLGLLGTVFGMIISFNELAQGSDANRSERLAIGIGHALITTAAGLAVAIFSIVLYMFLSGKIDQLVIEMDRLAQQVVNLISGEALASRPRMSAAKASPPVTATNPIVSTPLGKPKPAGA
jgi:biopolymer transport protein ExbB